MIQFPGQSNPLSLYSDIPITRPNEKVLFEDILKDDKNDGVRTFKNYLKVRTTYNHDTLDENQILKINEDYNQVNALCNLTNSSDISQLQFYLTKYSLNVTDLRKNLLYDILIDVINWNSSNTFIEFCMSLYPDNNFNYTLISISTPLYVALRRNNFVIANKLIKKGADINFLNEYSGNIIGYLLITESLNEKNLNYILKNNGENNLNIDIYSFLNTISKLYRSQTDIESKIISFFNIENSKSERATILGFDYILYEISQNYNEEKMNLINNMIKCKSFDINKIHKKSIELIIRNKYDKIIDFLIRYQDNFFSSQLFDYMIEYSVGCKDYSIFIFLFETVIKKCRIDNNNNLIFDLIKYLKNERIRKQYVTVLLNNNFDINIQNNGKSLLSESLRYHNEGLTRLLIENGADVNINVNDNCLLLESIKAHNDKLTKLLINTGANVNVNNKEMVNSLMYAIKYNNNSEIIKLLLQKKVSIEDKDLQNNTPLHYACKYNHSQALSILIKENIKLNEKNIDGYTPLMISIIERNWICTHNLLSQKDIDIFCVDNENNTPLYYMVNNSIKQNKTYYQLFKRGAYFNYKDINKKSFFKKIIENSELIKVFKDTDIPIYNDEKKILKVYNSLIFAITINNMTLLEELLKNGVDPNILNSDNYTPLMFAIKNNNLEAIKILVKYNVDYEKDKQNILKQARSSKEEILTYMLKLENIDENNVYYSNNNLLLLFKACSNEDIKGLEILFSNKDLSINVNERNSEGLTPLVYSIQQFKYKSAEFLLEKCNSLDVNIPDPNGETVLEYIINNNIQNLYNIIEKLIERGGYIDMKYFNKSSLDLIISNTDLIKSFIHSGIPIKDKDKRRYIIPNPLIFAVKQNNYSFTKILLENNAFINEIDSDHKTPFIYAIDNNNKSIINLLLDYHADINKRIDKSDVTPIIYSIEKNNSNIFNYLLNTISSDKERYLVITSIIQYSLNHKYLEMIDLIMDTTNYNYDLVCNIIGQLLNDGKIDIVNKDSDECSLYHYACIEGKHYVVKELVDTKQDSNIKDKEGKTPLMITILQKKFDCAKYILKYDSSVNVNIEDNSGETAMSYLLKNFDYDDELIELLYEKGVYFNENDFKNEITLKYIIKCSKLLKLFITKGIRMKTKKVNIIKMITTPLIFSVRNNYKILLINLLNLNANVNEIDENKKSALYYAINSNNIDIINILLNFNADITQEIMNEKTPLTYVIENEKMNIFNQLFQNKNIQDNFDSVLQSIYSYSCRSKNYDVITFIVNHLKDKFDIYSPLINFLNTDEKVIYESDMEKGGDLLHYSSYIGNLDLIKILLNKRYHFDINKKCKDGSTPLMLAIKNKKFECASKLMEYACNTNIKDNFDDTALTYMLKHSSSFNQYIMEKLIENGACIPDIYILDNDYLKYVINNKYLMKKITYEGFSIIDKESKICQIKQPLLYAVKNNNYFLASELIKNGAIINDIDENDNNALNYAIISKNLEMMKLLLSHNIELKTPFNNKSPIITTIKQNDPDLFKLIIHNISGSDRDNKIDDIVQNIIQYANISNDPNIIKFVHQNLDRKTYTNFEKLNNIIINKDKNYNVEASKEKQPLHYACMKGNIDDLKNLDKSTIYSINHQNKDGSTPLMVSLKNANYDCAKWLFNYYNTLSDVAIDVNIPDYNGLTPITFLLNNQVKDFELYKILIEHGAFLSINYIHTNTNVNIILNSDEMQDFILNHSIIIKDNNNKTYKVKNFIQFAIDTNNTKLISTLLKSKLNIEKLECNGKSPIIYSFDKNNKEAFNIFIKQVSESERDSYIRTIIYNAFSYNQFYNLSILKGWSNDQVVNDIINDFEKNRILYSQKGYKPLHEACIQCNKKLIEELLSYGYDINTKTNDTRETPLLIALKYRRYDSVKILLNNENINVNIPNKDQQTPLMIMIYDEKYINTEIFMQLILCKAQFLKRYKGEAPYIHAIKQKKFEYAKILLEQPFGVLDINYQYDRRGKNIISYMIDNHVDNGEIYDLLFKKGAVIESNYINDNKLIKVVSENAGLVTAIARYGINMFKESENKLTEIKTPVIFFVKSGRNQMVENLLKYGASVEETDKDGMTPIFHCINSNNTKCFFTMLQQYHADITKKNKKGQTPLAFALRRKNKNPVIISMLQKINRLNKNENKSNEINASVDHNSSSSSDNSISQRQNQELMKENKTGKNNNKSTLSNVPLIKENNTLKSQSNPTAKELSSKSNITGQGIAEKSNNKVNSVVDPSEFYKLFTEKFNYGYELFKAFENGEISGQSDDDGHNEVGFINKDGIFSFDLDEKTSDVVNALIESGNFPFPIAYEEDSSDENKRNNIKQKNNNNIKNKIDNNDNDNNDNDNNDNDNNDIDDNDNDNYSNKNQSEFDFFDDSIELSEDEFFLDPEEQLHYIKKRAIRNEINSYINDIVNDYNDDDDYEYNISDNESTNHDYVEYDDYTYDNNKNNNDDEENNNKLKKHDDNKNNNNDEENNNKLKKHDDNKNNNNDEENNNKLKKQSKDQSTPSNKNEDESCYDGKEGSKDSSTMYPELHYACIKENLSFIDMFINQFQFDINEKSDDGSTPLFVSIKFEKYKSIEFLLKYNANITIPDNEGETPISYILKKPSGINNKILQLFLPKLNLKQKYAPDKLNPLNYLIKYNNIQAIPILSKGKDFNINEVNNNGDTLLLQTVRNSGENELLIETLLSCGANVNQANNEGDIPLFYAIEQGNINLVKLLIKYKSKIDYKSPNGITPLKLAIKHNNVSIAKYLLDSKSS